MNEDVLIRIVDDDASVRDALVYMLDLEGFSVATYASAEEFLTTDAPSRTRCPNGRHERHRTAGCHD